MRPLLRLVLLPIAALVVLSACAASEDGPDAKPTPAASDTPPQPSTPRETPEPFRGLPDGVEPDEGSPAGVVVGEDGLVQVVTYGSSSNPAIVREVEVEGQTVTVDVSPIANRPSTMDYTPTTSAFFLPADVQTAEPIEFVLGKLGAVTLDQAIPGAAAWVERD